MTPDPIRRIATSRARAQLLARLLPTAEHYLRTGGCPSPQALARELALREQTARELLQLARRKEPTE